MLVLMYDDKKIVSVRHIDTEYYVLTGLWN